MKPETLHVVNPAFANNSESASPITEIASCSYTKSSLGVLNLAHTNPPEIGREEAFQSVAVGGEPLVHDDLHRTCGRASVDSSMPDGMFDGISG